MKNKHLFIALSFVFLIQSCTKSSSKISDAEMAIKVDSAMKATIKEVQEESDSVTKASNIAKMNNKQYKWTYYEKEDKMTSSKTHFAEIEANEVLRFGFPYDGGSIATLTLRTKNKSNKDIYLRVSKGQFKSDSDGGSVKIRFDDNTAKNYSYSESSDGSSDIIFLNNVNSITEKLKKSKVVLIQVEFYQEGLRTIEFYTEGLNWEY
jgi:hypothetical protein